MFHHILDLERKKKKEEGEKEKEGENEKKKERENKKENIKHNKKQKTNQLFFMWIFESKESDKRRRLVHPDGEER